ncbi:MAG: alpha/beta hydrolase [Rhizobiaceae bacterium]|nr:alpha/beta hydrolase [Rhizobiaceae bacterium]
MGGAAQWELQRGALEQHFNVITPDLPGFASKADLKAPDTIQGFAEHILDELTALGVDRFLLLGHSMGGMIVQEMAAIAPDRIEKLVLYGTAATGNLPDRFESFATSKQRVETDGVEASARRISATWFLDYEAASEFENCARIAEQSSLQALHAGLDAMQAWSRIKNLDNISCPTLIIWGEEDRTYHWPQIEQLRNTIPNASLAVLPGCSHAAHKEKPEIFNAALLDFLLDSPN